MSIPMDAYCIKVSKKVSRPLIILASTTTIAVVNAITTTDIQNKKFLKRGFLSFTCNTKAIIVAKTPKIVCNNKMLRIIMLLFTVTIVKITFYKIIFYFIKMIYFIKSFFIVLFTLKITTNMSTQWLAVLLFIVCVQCDILGWEDHRHNTQKWDKTALEKCHDERIIHSTWQANGLNDANKIIDYLYIGNICSAANMTFLIEQNIDYVLNIASEWNFDKLGGWDNSHMQYNNLNEYKVVFYHRNSSLKMINGLSIGQLKDNYKDTNINETLTKASMIIQEKIKNNETILVVCNFGKSRSAAAVIKYLMDTECRKNCLEEWEDIPSELGPAFIINCYKNKYECALQTIKTKRPIVQPNIYYEHVLRGLSPPEIIIPSSSTNNDKNKENVRDLL